MMKRIAIVISCEHAVNTVPEEYNALFEPFQSLLITHRAIDYGALAIAEYLQETIHCDFAQATTTRLLVDCNRSIAHFQCFSEITQNLSPTEKQRIINLYYLPFRHQIIAFIKNHIAKGFQVLHLSIHSFTPVMNDLVRNADIGLLYDPRRAAEKELAKKWKVEIKKQDPKYRVRMNYPYMGISDGFTSALRKQFTNNEYMGIEVESNEGLTKNAYSLDTLKNILAVSLLNIIC
jgi:predicted N-formylglutamate amidohydrolase